MRAWGREGVGGEGKLSTVGPCARTAVTFMLFSASRATMAAPTSQHHAKSAAERAGSRRSSSPGSPVPRPAIASATAASSAGRAAP